ncbi:Endonuclease YncB, thermonuclease family [Lentzea fradiae]|uniref:Endonuclease YncB, thermonuclease family n=1 Tax=Lentzea fradiae TaxID=200378 RepID=A0A1G7P0Z1_9PSEU|nr:cellulose binding domain-containing protein [Lentzea fradiae]SDF79965.1 Endonuclease YncB, thermonuclease family [Lentzea fradiae]
MAARKHILVLLTLLTASCTAEHDGRPVPGARSSAPAEERPQSTKVSAVVDGRTVELANGSRVRVSLVAEPTPCVAAAAREFATKTLLDKEVGVTSVSPGEVSLALPDGTDYALAAVRAGMLRTAAGVDGGPLTEAETEASRAKLGLWSCGGPTTQTSLPPSPSCVVVYRIGTQWPGAFQADVTVRNIGSVLIDGWTLRWTFADGQTVSQMWNATAAQSGADVTVTNAGYTALIVPDGSVTIGFNGTMSGRNSVPESFTLDGAPCAAG